MITCRELVDFLIDYVEGTLPPDEKAAFEEHLSVCPACQHYVMSYKTTIALSRVAFRNPDDEVPPEVPADLVKAIMAVRPPKK